jgi:hypothetical protein
VITARERSDEFRAGVKGLLNQRRKAGFVGSVLCSQLREVRLVLLPLERGSTVVERAGTRCAEALTVAQP